MRDTEKRMLFKLLLPLGEGWDEGGSKIRILNLNSNPALSLALSQKERGLKSKRFPPCPPW